MVWLTVKDVDMFILKTTGSYDEASAKISILYQRNLASGSVRKKLLFCLEKIHWLFPYNNEDGKDFSVGLRRTAKQILSKELNCSISPQV